MADRLRAKTRGFKYPIGDDVALVREAGGLGQLSDDVRRAVWDRMKEVKIGEFCDDMPAEAAARYLERGDLELVPAPKRARTAKTEGED